jgi:epoxyqueuosine reductase
VRLSAEAVKARALALGFNLVGIAPAEPSPFLEAYERWAAAGMHGEMAYMARPDRMERRRDLQVILPGARSLLVVGLDYGSGAFPEAALADPLRGRVAAYAWGLDYHEVMVPRLEQLAGWLSGEDFTAEKQRGRDTEAEREFLTQSGKDAKTQSRRGGEAEGKDFTAEKQRGGEAERENSTQSGKDAKMQRQRGNRVYVDTGPLLERGHGYAAGMGFIGKNTMLIHPRRGSTFFLGEILTTLEFDAYDQPGRPTLCGRCTRCLTACPTDAFPAPHVLDARRCISYLTIEHKGSIDPALRPLIGNWVYGCDVCQDVCPFQRFARPTTAPAFQIADLDRAAPPLVDLLALDEAAFKARYYGSAIYRVKRERLVRNACVAAGNSGAAELLPALERLTRDASELVREHAEWAMGQLKRQEY